jgi:hypothetical protein
MLKRPGSPPSEAPPTDASRAPDARPAGADPPTLNDVLADDDDTGDG